MCARRSAARRSLHRSCELGAKPHNRYAIIARSAWSTQRRGVVDVLGVPVIGITHHQAERHESDSSVASKASLRKRLARGRCDGTRSQLAANRISNKSGNGRPVRGHVLSASSLEIDIGSAILARGLHTLRFGGLRGCAIGAPDRARPTTDDSTERTGKPSSAFYLSPRSAQCLARGEQRHDRRSANYEKIQVGQITQI